VAVIEPASVAALLVVPLLVPVFTEGAVLIPLPLAATVTAVVTPPPATAMFPL